MKFAVKTATCLGCKTTLRPSNSVKSQCIHGLFSRDFISCGYLPDGVVCNNCRPRLSEFYQRQVCSPPNAFLSSSQPCNSRVPRHLNTKSSSLVSGHNASVVKARCIKMFCARAKIAPFSICEKSLRKMWRIVSQSWRSSIMRFGEWRSTLQLAW